MSNAEPTVYIVDDDPSVRESLESLFASLGLQAESFSAANDFLTHERREGPACLLLDVHLPGMNGWDLQRELAAAGDSIPVIFITGHGDAQMSVRAKQAGAIAFLVKPVREEQLLDAVSAAIKHDRHRRSEMKQPQEEPRL